VDARIRECIDPSDKSLFCALDLDAHSRLQLANRNFLSVQGRAGAWPKAKFLPPALVVENHDCVLGDLRYLWVAKFCRQWRGTEKSERVVLLVLVIVHLGLKVGLDGDPVYRSAREERCATPTNKDHGHERGQNHDLDCFIARLVDPNQVLPEEVER